MLPHLAIIPTDVLTIPSIAPAVVIRECCLQPLQAHVRRTHDGLAHVVEAVNHVPMVVLWQRHICL